MSRLLKDYDLSSDMQYFEMIVESVINGQRTQARELFNEMPRADRRAFVVSITGNWQTGLSQQDKEMFINLL